MSLHLYQNQDWWGEKGFLKLEEDVVIDFIDRYYNVALILRENTSKPMTEHSAILLYEGGKDFEWFGIIQPDRFNIVENLSAINLLENGNVWLTPPTMAVKSFIPLSPLNNYIEDVRRMSRL